MNPWGLDPTSLVVWGVVVHLIADWLLQNDWMAANKAKRRVPDTGFGGQVGNWLDDRLVIKSHWWDRHPAAYVHAGIHGIGLTFVFGWVAILIAITHLVIDTRTPVAWFAKLMRQTEPLEGNPIVSVGALVRINVDQVFHVVILAIAAILVGAFT